MSWIFDFSRYVADLATAPCVKAVIGLCWLCIGYLFGLPNPATEALIYLMIIDYALGTAHAWKDNRQSFQSFARGVLKFIVYGVAINIANHVDVGIGPMAFGISFQVMLCGYLCANEALSALTHLGEFGVPIPPWFMERLRNYRKTCENPRRRASDKMEEQHPEMEGNPHEQA